MVKIQDIRLGATSPVIPCGVRELLTELGGGENGFGGTAFAAGEKTLEEQIKYWCEMADPANVRPGLVPQTVFWALDAAGEAVGMVRVRHCLNDKLLFHGGHIGYFIRRDRRGMGYATEVLRLALIELRKLGEPRALLTVDARNAPSIRVIEKNAGRLEDEVTDAETGKRLRRYWIELA